MLADHEIEAAVESGHLGWDPYDPTLLQPNSIDVRLSEDFLLPDLQIRHIDLADVPSRHMIGIRISGIKMLPGDFLLASTVETVRVPNDLVARVEGKSSLARLGLVVHVTAGFIDSGFSGQITLELVNMAPWAITLHAGMTIAQVAFERCAPVRTPYQGRYNGQRGPVESRYDGARRAT